MQPSLTLFYQDLWSEHIEEASAHYEQRTALIAFLEPWVPRFEADNRSYLTVAAGCTGGHHRSVYVTECLSAHFRKVRDEVIVRHRELP